MSNAPQAKLRIGSEAFFATLARVARASGSDHFYDELVAFLAAVLGSERWLVMRYALYAAPEFVVNRAMTPAAIKSYLEGLYRLDPLLRLWRERRDGTVVSLSQLRREEPEDRYFDDIFRTALIYDELAVMLPAPGRICVALCCDRAKGCFGERDLKAAQTLFPLLDGLHWTHLDRVFSEALQGTGGTLFQDIHQAFSILDRDRNPVLKSDSWQRLESESLDLHQAVAGLSPGSGMVSFGQGRVLHWEELGSGFAIAPQGKICVVEERSPGYLGADFNKALESFERRFNLTPREREIVELIARGFPNAAIAKELGISAGTVRNHRYRLYFKLDITTERELFSLFLQDLFASEGLPAAREGTFGAAR